MIQLAYTGPDGTKIANVLKLIGSHCFEFAFKGLEGSSKQNIPPLNPYILTYDMNHHVTCNRGSLPAEMEAILGSARKRNYSYGPTYYRAINLEVSLKNALEEATS